MYNRFTTFTTDLLHLQQIYYIYNRFTTFTTDLLHLQRRNDKMIRPGGRGIDIDSLGKLLPPGSNGHDSDRGKKSGKKCQSKPR